MKEHILFSPKVESPGCSETFVLMKLLFVTIENYNSSLNSGFHLIFRFKQFPCIRYKFDVGCQQFSGGKYFPIK
jgi:hypothetical protein